MDFKNILNSIQSLFKQTAKDDTLERIERALAKSEKNKSILSTLEPKQSRVNLGMQEFKSAITLAENVIRPRRERLMEMYKKVAKDNHLAAQIQNRKEKILKNDFLILRNGTADLEATKAIQEVFFYDLISYALDAQFYGNSLIELGYTDANGIFYQGTNKQGKFDTAKLIDRRYIVPEFGVLLLRLSDSEGLDYRNKSIKEFRYLIEFDNEDFGLLEKAAPQVIRKNYALEDWSIRTEKFGMPFIALFTDEQDKIQIDAFENMLRNMGSNGYGIFGNKDRNAIEYIEANAGANAHQIYSELIKLCNEEISKLIVGGTATTDEKAWVGSADVHERMFNTIVASDMRYIEMAVNNKVLPTLAAFGYGFEDCKFEFVTEKISTPGSETDPEPQPEPEPENRAFPKKKDKHEECCGELITREIPLEIDLEQVVKDVFEEKLASGDISKEAYDTYMSVFLAAIQEGWENIDPSDLAFYTELQTNTAVFAAFKSHSLVTELASILSSGESYATFSQFKKAANALLNNYNQNWLLAEYNTAVASAQAAERWRSIERNKDIFPNLEYRTQNDAAVRDAHSKLNGIVRSVDDVFWNTYYPPNSWNCRCFVRPRGAGVSETAIPASIELPKSGFVGNVGKTANIFSLEDSSYAKSLSDSQKKKIEEFAQQQQQNG